MKAVIFCLFLTLIVLFGCDKYGGQDRPTEKLPNVVWLVSEDNSPFIGVYGDSLARTPRIDKFASEGILYENAFANAPVCAPSRSTLITGMYATSLGTQHMRCLNPVPDFVRFFPHYLKQAGYYTTNRQKTDYNAFLQEGVWDNNWWEWKDAFKGKNEGQPFFLMYNTFMSHEDKIHSDDKAVGYYKVTLQALLDREFSDEEIADSLQKFNFEAGDIPLPPYHPPTEAMFSDWARYYSRIQMMDEEIGIVLDLMDRQGLLENTIVFYFSDHGGVLPRSKRFPFESGLKVPLIIRFPEKYRMFAPGNPGDRVDKVVSFVDFAPSILGLAGIPAPEHMEGQNFLGKDKDDVGTLAFGFRGRMDERYDMVRTVRDKNFRYMLNFMPHRIYGQPIQFLWRAPSMQSWEEAFQQGRTNRTQSRFFSPKLPEELYDVLKDPYCVNNLALNPSFAGQADEYRQIIINHMIKTHDTGVLPEALMMQLSEGSTPYAYSRGLGKEYEHILRSALAAAEGRRENLDLILEMLKDTHPAVRYWGATGCVILREGAMEMKELLTGLLDDPYVTVRIAACEALYKLGEQRIAINVLGEILENDFNVLLEKEKAIEGYAPEVFELTHALNVIHCIDYAGSALDDKIRVIAGKEKSDYSKRAAEYLVRERKMVP
jgi:arylsulfatase A-like enzyme